MILFCDTSALLKLFIDEQGSESMINAHSSSKAIAVCRITWAESMAALAQRTRFKGTNQSRLAQARSMFEQAWPGFVIADITKPLVEKAGVFAEAFALRGFDSVQLAAAYQLHEQFALPLTFACFDRRLNQAAKLLQLEVLP
ncbi:MAG: type II toxin-antitoxin system VapC family toxin [Cyanobacteriota bacterium]